MPVYNAEVYLAAALESILAQTVGDFDLIAVNDGSSDTSLHVLQEFAARDARVQIISRPNTGIVGALNDGLATARGEFLARMDADDVALPHRFEAQLAYLRSHPECVAVGSAVLQIDPDGDPICVQPWAQSHEEIERLLLSGGGGLAHPAAMIRTAAMHRIGGYRKQYEWIEDKDLWLRLAEVGRLANLREPLLKYRLHEGSVCSHRHAEQARLWEELLAEVYARRGLGERSPTLPHRQIKRSARSNREKWIRSAARSGNLQTAKKHIGRLLKEHPLRASTWLALARNLKELTAKARRTQRPGTGSSSGGQPQ
jgi:glycosyltransferase involved in cell wall biosynthesis